MNRRNRDQYEVIDDIESFQELHFDDDGEKLQCFAYKYSKLKIFFYHTFSLLLIGLPYLWVYWYEYWEAYFKCKRSLLKNADIILLKGFTGDICLERVFSNSNSSERYFVHRKLKFIWDSEKEEYVRLRGLDRGDVSLAQALDNSLGHTSEEQLHLQKLHGLNLIDIEIKSYWQLFVGEVFHPFYIFQVGSMILWSLDHYYIYAGCVLALSVLSLIVALVETRRQSNTMRDMVSASNSTTVLLCRKGKDPEVMPSACLVPGDLIVIPPNGCLMTCDALLLVGNCIVNESMLTGESIPVTKTPPSHSDEIYNAELHKRHTLFCGTDVIQTRFYGNDKVIAVVVRTGFSTAKGELIRSILFPKPMGFKFYQDSVKFILVLFSIATIGMAYCIYVYIKMGADMKTIIVRTLDILTIVVPPALPAAMTVGTVYAQGRLRKRGIFCISPPRINICGKLKLICFDKTGTLTEDGLDLWGVIPNHQGHFDHPQREPSLLQTDSPLMVSMAVCHSLTMLEGQLTGDPLDLRMFEATRWVLEEPGKDTEKFDLLLPTVVRPCDELLQRHPAPEIRFSLDGEQFPYEVGIIRQFPFSSSAQCMSVIARTLGDDHMNIYCKGAPEKIQTLCIPTSIPSNFSELLIEYASSGFRVLAIAYKPLDIHFSWRQSQRVKRELVEQDLQFLGLLVMKNSLKPETAVVIQQLHQACLRLVMITGDNLLTAISVSRECGLISPTAPVITVIGYPPDGSKPAKLDFQGPSYGSENRHQGDDHVSVVMNSQDVVLALEGKTWAIIRQFFPSVLSLVLARGSVFARMAPEQKSQLVEELQQIDYVVAMCGDGANDCGALKAAHIGVSLSEAEASVAAPFTSRISNISCMVSLVQEGRCALVTSFGVFKFMALYSITQFVSVLILYTNHTNLGDMQFLYIDLVITTSLAVVMGRTGPSDQLVAKRPPGSLASIATVLPLLIQIGLTAGAQLAAYYILHAQPWYKGITPLSPLEENRVVANWENTVIFCVSCFQYLILATAYSKGEPYRKPFYTNYWFLLTLLLLIGFNTLLMLYPLEPLASFFQLIPFHKKHRELMFRLTLLWLPAIHLILSLLCECAIADSNWIKKLIHFLTRKTTPKNKYKMIQNQLNDGEEGWPDFNSAITSDIRI